MLLFKINPEKYVHFGTLYPHPDFYLSGWNCELKYFLWIIPYIIYTKKLIK